ncbi:MAG: glycosyltransferase family 1 protein [Sphaerospermopsis sp. SIO1G2]|nr:glycosyltransferase family 1 protein [Sphaerospermopsis sp. SIO1G2]
MRIFTSIKHSLHNQEYGGDLWSRNFYPALHQLGHEIIESQTDLLAASRFMHVANHFTNEEEEVRAVITQKIIDEVIHHHQQQPIDLFLSYFYNSHFHPGGFEKLHKLGILTVNFYCNSIYQLELVSQIASKVNISWHTEKYASQKYKDIGANPIWVQLGANPELYHPIPDIKRQHKACFVGQRYADRDRFIAALLTQDLPVDIYGSGWISNPVNNKHSLLLTQSHSQENTQALRNNYLGRLNPSIGSLAAYRQVVIDNLQNKGILKGFWRTLQQFYYRRNTKKLRPIIAPAYKGYASSLSETFAAYEVVLNFSNVWADGHSGSQLIPHVRMRDFEAPMSCSCYLTGYTDEIADFYKIGQEIDTYTSANELADKLKFYLSHPYIANSLREQGYKRAINEHTWVNRFQKLFQILNLS